MRWYQFGTFCPIMRTHGCRAGVSPEPNPFPKECSVGQVCTHTAHSQGALTHHLAGSGGIVRPKRNMGVRRANRSHPNQVHPTADGGLSRVVRFSFSPTPHSQVLKPYILELARNVSLRGAVTMRALTFEFPEDARAVGINDQYLLGPRLLVAPVVDMGAREREVYFPAGARWRNFWNASATPVPGGTTATVEAPLDIIPVYERC